MPISLLTLLVYLFISGCAYTLRPVRYDTMSALMTAMSEKNPDINSIKALATVSVKIDDRHASFPEGMIISGNAIRLETLNIFYQPLLVLIYNRTVSILNVDTGTCSVYSSADSFRYFTYLDIPPEVFKSLVTGRLPGTPSKMTVSKNKFVLSGERDSASWIASVNDKLLPESTNIEMDNGIKTFCTYDDYAAIDGVRIPFYVRCKWKDNRITIHYDKVHINGKVDPELMDADKLCNHG